MGLYGLYGVLWVYLGLYTQSDLEPSPMFIGKRGYSDGLPMDVENYMRNDCGMINRKTYGGFLKYG